MKTLCFVFVGVALAAMVTSLNAATWAGFRGGSGDGISTEKNLPIKWSAASGVKWKVTLPGRDNSSPVVTTKRVYLTTQTKDLGLWIIAIDKASGKEAWRKKVAGGEGAEEPLCTPSRSRDFHAGSR